MVLCRKYLCCVEVAPQFIRDAPDELAIEFVGLVQCPATYRPGRHNKQVVRISCFDQCRVFVTVQEIGNWTRELSAEVT